MKLLSKYDDFIKIKAGSLNPLYFCVMIEAEKTRNDAFVGVINVHMIIKKYIGIY